MPEKSAPAEAVVHRHILRSRNALLAVGRFGNLFDAYLAHVRRWDLPLDGLGEVMMRQALAAAALQLAFRVPEERTAWTLNVDQPPLNLFAAGGGPESRLVGRYFTEDVRTVGESRLFVQRAHPRSEPTQSVLAVQGLDVLVMIERFYAQSEQLPARLIELSDTEMAMVLALPDADPAWLGGLDADGVRAALAGDPEPIEERTFHWECGCDGERVALALAGMFGRDPDSIFEGEEGVEASCPRCGTRWWIDRPLFDRMALRSRADRDHPPA